MCTVIYQAGKDSKVQGKHGDSGEVAAPKFEADGSKLYIHKSVYMYTKHLSSTRTHVNRISVSHTIVSL